MAAIERNRDEYAEVEQVVDRLGEKFEELPRAVVADVVHHVHLGLQGNPIREYVPVLVEHGAKEQLRAIRRGLADQPGAGADERRVAAP
ncbi:three-helix bundle dimerization domain-containing protein [Agromyces sp. SYSU T00194]|uniref:three-helix bundle dimerization domain-containing protein n=1 Tax=Agromyces chitinivorans TaxID=3158560 RepID=UPI00339B6B45